VSGVAEGARPPLADQLLALTQRDLVVVTPYVLALLREAAGEITRLTTERDGARQALRERTVFECPATERAARYRAAIEAHQQAWPTVLTEPYREGVNTRLWAVLGPSPTEQEDPREAIAPGDERYYR
jgi:hypothetical protein